MNCLKITNVIKLDAGKDKMLQEDGIKKLPEKW